MIVVSDNSVLVGLAAIEQFDLLHRLFGRVIIPTAVRDEFIADKDREVLRKSLLEHSWLEIRTPSQPVIVLPKRLDPGETAAIALAMELNADLLLIDEVRGRVIATQMRLRVTGLLGILREAKQRGLFPAIAPLIARLRHDFGFYLHDQLVAELLKSVGETDPLP